MADQSVHYLSLDFWAHLMGRDLPPAPVQPLQPVMIEDRKLRLFQGVLCTRFAPGAKVGFRLDGGRVVMEETPNGTAVEEAGLWDEFTHVQVELPNTVRGALPGGKPLFGLMVAGGKCLELLPVRVEEHEADVLGPRIIDELRRPDGSTGVAYVVRHIVRGHNCEEWTEERVGELAALVSATPLARDPLPQLAGGDDWVAWKTRNDILRGPDPGDGKLRRTLEGQILDGQLENGSWGGCPVRTAYRILRARSVGVSADDARLQRAAGWLLDLPEPEGRPGMWMQAERHLHEWNAIKRGERQTDDEQYLDEDGFSDADHELYRSQESQQVIPTCCRNFGAVCYSRMLHPSATIAYALSQCGHAGHPRLKDYASTMLQVGGMFGYFCACWGIVDFDMRVQDLGGSSPDFDERRDEYGIALRALRYGYARDADDLRALAFHPHYPGVHRPDLADTNGWVPYEWKDIGMEERFALVGAYWQNADCWAKTNRALAQLPTWPDTIAAFLALFQCHLYQTPLGAWDQGYPAGILGWIADVTRTARQKHGIDGSPALRLAKVMLLKTVPWLRERQKGDGLWDHEELPRFGGGELNRPPSRRLGSYHIVAALSEFGLLQKLLSDC